MQPTKKNNLQQLRVELSHKRKSGLLKLGRQYGIEINSRQTVSEITDILLKNSEKIIPDLFTEPVSKEELHRALKLDRPFNRIAGWASIVGLVLGIGFFFFPLKKHSEILEQPRVTESKFDPFESDDSNFNILILPFMPLEDCSIQETQIEQTIQKRLVKLNRRENLRLQVRFFSGSTCPDSFEDGRRVGKKFRADLVLWGDIYEQCHFENGACVQYALVKNNLIDERTSGETNIIPFKSTSEIMEGTFQGEIDFIIFWTLGLKASQQGDFHKAIGYFERLTPKTDRSIVLVYLALGKAFSYLNNWKKAKENYEKGIKVSPAIAYHYLDNPLYNPDKTDSIIKSISLLIKQKSGNMAAKYNNRGEFYRFQKRFDLALIDYSMAISLEPELYFLFYNRGITYLALEEFENAIEDLECFFEIGEHKIMNSLLIEAGLKARLALEKAHKLMLPQ